MDVEAANEVLLEVDQGVVASTTYKSQVWLKSFPSSKKPSAT